MESRALRPDLDLGDPYTKAKFETDQRWIRIAGWSHQRRCRGAERSQWRQAENLDGICRRGSMRLGGTSGNERTLELGRASSDEVAYSPRLHLLDQKYIKNRKNMKYYQIK